MLDDLAASDDPGIATIIQTVSISTNKACRLSIISATMIRAMLFAASAASAFATSRTGSFSTQPYVANPIMGFSYSFFGEGIEYDSLRDRVLLGTLSSGGPSVQGRIFAVPYVDPEVYDDDFRVVYDQAAMVPVYYDVSQSR